MQIEPPHSLAQQPRFCFFPAETFPNIWEYTGLRFWQDGGWCVFPVAPHKAYMNLLHLKVGEAGRVMQKLKCSDCITIQTNHAE